MGYSRKDIADMKRAGYTQKDLKKLLKGQGAVGGNMVGGAKLNRRRIKEIASTFN